MQFKITQGGLEVQISRVNLQTTNNSQKQNQSQPSFGIFSEKLGSKIAKELGNVRKLGAQILDDFAYNTDFIDRHGLHVHLDNAGKIQIFSPDQKRFHCLGQKVPFHVSIAETVTKIQTGDYLSQEAEKFATAHQERLAAVEASKRKVEEVRQVLTERYKGQLGASITDPDVRTLILERDTLGMEETRTAHARMKMENSQRVYEDFFSHVVGAKKE